MADQSWGDGYVVDVDYTHGYYRELSPSAVHFVTQLAGLQAVRCERPFVYVELGCGNGDSLGLHAAANPLGQFIGVDFNPAHIHSARRLAEEAGIGNARFVETSFADLLAADLPEPDIVVLHGVYSWINPENRGHIVDYLRRRLKPGGIVYLSYNCLPGLNQIQPLQYLLHAHAELGVGAIGDRIDRAIGFATRLGQAGADYLRVSPMAVARLSRLTTHDPRYLAHEYFNANWTPFYHTQVVADLAEAKLAYAGSAHLLENFDQFSVRPELASLVGEIGDRALAETVRDFARNQAFRRDVFTRGAPDADLRERMTTLARTRFALSRPRSVCVLSTKTPAGDVSLTAPVYAGVLDALARRPMRFDELMAAPEVSGADAGTLRQAVFGMAAFGNVLPALPVEGEGERAQATARYNRAVLQRPVRGSARTTLASPVLGAGIVIGGLDRLLLGAPEGQAERRHYVRASADASGLRLMREGKEVEPDATDAFIDERGRVLREEFLPYLRQMGAI